MAPRVWETAFIFSAVSTVGYGFRCDGMFPLIGGRTLPDSYVNDNYCDCDDRSDEPGTNACAMLTKAKSTTNQMFQCHDTKGYAPLAVPSHMKGDGICDCCDGSDEVAGVCPDECAVWAAEEAAKEEARKERYAAGQAKFKQYVELGSQAKVEQQREYEEIELKLKEMEVEVEKAQKLRDLLEVSESEARVTKKAEAQAELNEQYQLDQVNDPTDLLIRFAIATKDVQALMALVVDRLDSSVTDRIDDVEVLSLATDAQSTYFDEDTQVPPSEEREQGEGGAAESEGQAVPLLNKETQLMVFVDKLKDALSLNVNELPLKDAAGTISLHALSREMLVSLAVDLKQSPLLIRLSREVRGLVSSKFEVEPEDASVWDDWKMPETTEAIENVKSLEKEKRSLESKLKDKKNLEGDYGVSNEWFTLSQKCFVKNTAGFEYKICPFKDAKQDTTNLGKWAGWGDASDTDQTSKKTGEGVKVMKFDKGTKCWNGPARSLTVTVSCGAEDEVLSVEEPDTCRYVAEMNSPAACS